MLTPDGTYRGNAGLRQSSPNPLSGQWNDIYVAAVAGIDSSPDRPYIVICRAHGEQISARSLTTARILAGNAATWCSCCKALSHSEECEKAPTYLGA
jgi:hypothetical protein